MAAADHCTLWFEGAWAACCAAHDAAYDAGVDRGLADAALGACVADGGHPLIAAIMFLGVSLFGGIAYAFAKSRRRRKGRGAEHSFSAPP